MLLLALSGFLIKVAAAQTPASPMTAQVPAPPTQAPTALAVPLAGNTWASQDKGGELTDEGIRNWTDPHTTFTTYVRISQPGSVHVWIRASFPSGPSDLTLELRGKGDPHTITAGDSVTKDYDLGQWTVRDTGYLTFRLSVRPSGSRGGGPAAELARVQALLIGGDVTKGPMAYVPNNEGNFFYWGRRGPSVHLNYEIPKDLNAEWFYNEVTVPVGQDKEGSYFMADGFGQGYFGMQVNSPTERHILFSVWSPFQTDDPKSIPDSMKILLARKGDNVHAGAFGNEGSGGQSYMNFMWKAGNTYKFLLKALPEDHGYTEFTAWFFAPETGHWQLIASFRRPQTQSWLKGLHSFLENFDPEQGDKSRYVLFNHQWVADAQGHWTAVTRARFTGDNTARKGYRLDYAGGLMDGAFFLKNAGFFAERVPLNTWFDRTAAAGNAAGGNAATGGNAPDIDFSRLP